jgi:hypothetical protein
MKVLFDPIYSTQPYKCSSAYKFKVIAERLLAGRDDVFIYWPVPEWADEASLDWLPKSDRVKYVGHAVTKDRVREYQCFYRELEDKISFHGSCWDYDVLVTMRTAQLPTMRVAMNSPRQKRQTWLKKLVLLEEMAILDFRLTVPVSNSDVQDMQTIAGYLASDVSYITANHVRDGILRTARGIFAPSRVRELDQKLRLVNPVAFSDTYTKPVGQRFKRGEQPFCLGFVGRMSNSMTRLPDVYDVMDKSWIMKGDLGFKVIISTVSTGVKLPPPDFVVFENNPRDVFWKRVKEDMHLVISMSIDAEFSMSLIEPVLFGTPLVIARKDWTEGLLGKEYPFFIKGKTQALGMVKAFYEDYGDMYAQFLDWRDNVFLPRFLPGGIYERNLYVDVLREIGHFDRAVAERFAEEHPNKENNKIAALVAERVKDRDEFRLFDVLKELGDAGELRNLDDKLDEEDGKRNLTFMTPWHELKVILQAFFGFEDASTDIGHMRRRQA